jgi:hypothetical protein
MGREQPPAFDLPFRERLQLLPVQARWLLCAIVRLAYQGPLRSKAPGRVTMPEIHETCGLDVDELQGLIALLEAAGLVSLAESYPFQEVQLEGANSWEDLLNHCKSAGVPLEAVVAG